MPCGSPNPAAERYLARFSLMKNETTKVRLRAEGVFMAKKMKTMDGNTATTHIAYALSDVACIYPITAVFRHG